MTLIYKNRRQATFIKVACHGSLTSNDSSDQGITQEFQQFVRQAISTTVKHLRN